MNEEFEYFYEQMGPLQRSSKVPDDFIEKYQKLFPSAYIEFLKETGWGCYQNGLLWITDPRDFILASQAWLSGLKQFVLDEYHVFARDAFGNLYLWGNNSGNCITIHPLSSTVVTSEPEKFESEADRNLDIGSFFVTRDNKDYDFDDFKEKPMFQRALKKLGPLSADEMYAFEPALCIGGLPKLENLVKVKMIEHLHLLSQLADIEFMHIDVSSRL